jgi:hypothetical protein
MNEVTTNIMFLSQTVTVNAITSTVYRLGKEIKLTDATDKK